MKEIIQEALAVLKRGGIILYPTDTVWGIGCDPNHEEAIAKIFALKNRPQDQPLLCLVSDFKMLNMYVEDVPEVAYDILKYASKPTTLILDDPIRVSETLIAADNSLGYRVVRADFCNQLIRKMRKPLVSTSANKSGHPTPMHFEAIDQSILDGVDYVVPLEQRLKSSPPSAIIKLSKDGKVKVIRK